LLPRANAAACLQLTKAHFRFPADRFERGDHRRLNVDLGAARKREKINPCEYMVPDKLTHRRLAHSDKNESNFRRGA
jgi:hypothetical protein